MNSIEELRKKYYEAIILLQNEQDILDSLPQPDYGNFFPIIAGLIERLDEETTNLQAELQNNEQIDIEMKEYVEEEIKILMFKKELCISLLQKGNEEKTILEEAAKTPKKNIIFATTNNGNVCIENDIKTLPEEYYESLIAMLQNLQNGIEESNGEKAKVLTTVHKKLAGTHEIKEFKVRLFYKILSPDTIYVLMVRMKKSDNDALDRNEIINRVTQRNQQFEKLKKQIKEPQIKSELIAENEKIIINLYDYLNKNKRGK